MKQWTGAAVGIHAETTAVYGRTGAGSGSHQSPVISNTLKPWTPPKPVTSGGRPRDPPSPHRADDFAAGVRVRRSGLVPIMFRISSASPKNLQNSANAICWKTRATGIGRTPARTMRTAPIADPAPGSWMAGILPTIAVARPAGWESAVVETAETLGRLSTGSRLELMLPTVAFWKRCQRGWAAMIRS